MRNRGLIGNLSASYAVSVDISPAMLEKGKSKYPQVQFVNANAKDYASERAFNTIIISETLGTVGNIQKLLERMQRMTTSDTRIINNYYNELWDAVLPLTEKRGWKITELTYNRLSNDDIANIFNFSVYEIVCKDFLMLLPVRIPVLSKSLVSSSRICRFCAA